MRRPGAAAAAAAAAAADDPPAAAAAVVDAAAPAAVAAASAGAVRNTDGAPAAGGTSATYGAYVQAMALRMVSAQPRAGHRLSHHPAEEKSDALRASRHSAIKWGGMYTIVGDEGGGGGGCLDCGYEGRVGGEGGRGGCTKGKRLAGVAKRQAPGWGVERGGGRGKAEESGSGG